MQRFDDFNQRETNQFSFLRVPKKLFDKEFSTLPCEAKFLYGLLLDRMSLSTESGWRDEKNRIYIIYPVTEMGEALGRKDSFVYALLETLESTGLIERKRQGAGKPTLIYLKNIFRSDPNP